MDIEFLLFLQNIREATGGIFNDFFLYVTKFGETSVLILPLAAIYWCLDKKKGSFIFFSFYSSRVINGFAKITACVYRPWIRDVRIQPVPEAQAEATGYSFPSGHTANAASAFGSIAAGKNCGRLLRIMLIAVILLVGFSRNYLGVHTPEDVLVSLVLGSLAVFISAKAFALAEKSPNNDIIICLCGCAVCIVLIAYAALKSYPMNYDANGSLIVDPSKMAVDSYKNAGMGLGLYIGWLLEKRFICFSTDGTWQEKALRFIICALCWLLLSQVVCPMIQSAAGGGLGAALSSFVSAIYVIAGAPFVIRIMQIKLYNQQKGGK